MGLGFDSRVFRGPGGSLLGGMSPHKSSKKGPHLGVGWVSHLQGATMPRVESAERGRVMMSPQVPMHSSGAAANKRGRCGSGDKMWRLSSEVGREVLQTADSKRSLIRSTFSSIHLNRSSSSHLKEDGQNFLDHLL